MGKKIMKILFLAFYAVLILSHCFFRENAWNVSLSSKMFFAHFYSFPVFFGVFFSGLSILTLASGFVKAKKEYLYSKNFLFPGIFLILSMVFIFYGSDAKKISQEDAKKETLKIAEWNLQNTLSADIVKKVFKEFDADIAVFPELGGHQKGDSAERRLFAEMEAEGISPERYEVFSSPETGGAIAPVTVAVKKDRLKYEEVISPFMTCFGTVYLHSSDQTFPNIVSLHTAPPLPGLMEVWNRDLKMIAEEIFPNYKEAVILGDFNATGRHGLLNFIDSHEDAIDYLPLFERGTWGLFLPKPFRTSIDHIYFPKGKYLMKSVDLAEARGPDHVGVFLELMIK